MVAGVVAVLSGGSDEGEGDGEVVRATGLVRLARIQVDDDFLAGDGVPVRLQGGDGAEEDFLHRGVDNADQMDPDSVGNSAFHINADAFDSIELDALYHRKHNSNNDIKNMTVGGTRNLRTAHPASRPEYFSHVRHRLPPSVT